MNRRQMLALGAATVVVAQTRRAFAQTTPAKVVPDIETRSLDELHKAALAEGGDLIVYAGGDLPNGAAGTEKAFVARFPGMKLRILTDLSKYHDARIDNQLARGRLECDLAHLQTLHDFDRWKAEGRLMLYKPLGWDQVYGDFKDPDGAYTAMAVIAFSSVVNVNLIAEAEAPRGPLDFLDPKLKGKIVLTYPHDDDAVLYQFDRIVSTYGWEYMDRLLAQEPQWIRGTAPARLVVERGGKAASFTASGPLVAQPGSPLRFLLPRSEDFLAWPQTAGIFNAARHPAAAKLYLSWLLSREMQQGRWPVRRDVAPPTGYTSLFDYPTFPVRFRAFMQDRARIERLKFQFEHYIGPAQGPNPTEVKGLYPVGR
jgi:ABC-type Fe3+ transport system substrate-binding protein